MQYRIRNCSDGVCESSLVLTTKDSLSDKKITITRHTGTAVRAYDVVRRFFLNRVRRVSEQHGSHLREREGGREGGREAST